MGLRLSDVRDTLLIRDTLLTIKNLGVGIPKTDTNNMRRM